MLLQLLGYYFAFAAGCALVGLCVVCLDRVPPIAGTVALIVTLAALAVAILH